MSKHLRSIATACAPFFFAAWACTPGTSPVAPPAAAAAPAPAPDAEPWRSKTPPPGPEPELHAPVPLRSVLPSSLTVLTVHKPTLPLVTLTVTLRSGSADDPPARPGVAGFVGEMLRSGTKTRSAQAIADEIETLGASLDVSVSEDSLSISVSSLEENFGAVFDVVADVLQHPAFDSKEIERARRRRLGALAEALDDPNQTASRVFRQVVFGPHPYGHTVLGEEAAVKTITRQDLVAYYNKHFRPANAAAVVVGSLAPDKALAEVTRRLGGWKGAAGVTTPPSKPSDQAVQIVLIDRAGAPQSQLRIGHLGVSRAHPDYYALVICNAILGGLFSSRINMNLREDKGYTYGARSAFDFLRGDGSFYVSTGVETSVTAPAIREILNEIERMRTSNVSDDELTVAKSKYTVSLPGYFQTVGGIAGMVTNIYLYDLPLDYYQQLPQRIRAVTIADVRRVSEQHLQPEKLSIVVVGDRSKVAAELSGLKRGPVGQRDPAGNVL